MSDQIIYIWPLTFSFLFFKVWTSINSQDSIKESKPLVYNKHLLLLLLSHSVVSNSLPPEASLSLTISRSLLKLMPTELMMPSNHLILCHPLLLLPSTLPSIRVFSSELALLVRWPKYWSFSFSISPSNEYSGLISFRVFIFFKF